MYSHGSQGRIQQPVAIKIFCIVSSGAVPRKFMMLQTIDLNVRTSQDLDLKLLKITLVNFTYPVQCPKVPPLSHCSWCGRALMRVLRLSYLCSWHILVPLWL